MIDFADDQIGNMMHWEKPLKDQPEHILKTAKRLLSGSDLSKYNISALEEGDLTGEDFYKILSDKIDRANPHPMKEYSDDYRFANEEASKILHDSGIPGHKYAASTAKHGVHSKVKHNYVVYPGAEKHINILRSEPIK
jgi:hypothetical protein